jgi:hypothetical protein
VFTIQHITKPKTQKTNKHPNMQSLKPAPTKEHLLSINASHTVTPIDSERVRKLVPIASDASVNLNAFRYLPKKVQAKVDSQDGVRVQNDTSVPSKSAAGNGKKEKVWIDPRKVKCCNKTCLRNTPNPDKTLQLRSVLEVQVYPTNDKTNSFSRTDTGMNIEH